MERPPWQDAWDGVLEWLTQIVTPDWNDLIPLIPSALLALMVATLAFVAWRWMAHTSVNRSRVPRRRLAPAPPEGVHLPGPSPWPFVLPVAGAFVFASLAFRPRNDRGELTDPFNWPLLLIGLVIGLVGIAGWYRDAMREWRRTDAAAPVPPEHGPAALEQLRLAGFLEPSVAVTEPAGPPPGVHLPGPSPWPLFAPLALFVIFAGLVFHPVLVVAGIAMGAVAAIGWLRDAGREYRVLEGEEHHPTNQDPRRAIPRAAVAAYGGILAVALLVVAMPGLIAFANPAASAPPTQDPGTGGPGGPASITLIGQDIQWDKTELTAPADQPFQIAMENKDTQPHNVSIYESEERAQQFFKGEALFQPGTITYDVPALAAGSYFFVCDFHAGMTGTLTAQ